MVDGSRAVLARDLLREFQLGRIIIPASELRQDVAVVASGLDELDSLCAGGLPRGHVTEVVTPPCGGATILYTVLAAATSKVELAALVDPQDGFDPVSATRVGVHLQRLLWVRARDVKESLRAVELILDAGGFGLVALDLGVPVAAERRDAPPPPAAWMRIRKRASDSGAVALVLSSTGSVGTFASLSVAVRQRRIRWRGKSDQARWLEGIDLAFELLRKRYG
jgi:hypothetical protein